MKIIEAQGNLNKLPSVTEGVSGHPRISVCISLTSLCLTPSPMLTHIFGRNEKFLCLHVS